MLELIGYPKQNQALKGGNSDGHNTRMTKDAQADPMGEEQDIGTMTWSIVQIQAVLPYHDLKLSFVEEISPFRSDNDTTIVRSKF